MQATGTDFLDGISFPPESRIEVSLAYQDLRTGLRARRFLDHVLDHCQMQVDFGLTPWNLALFHHPEIREQAVLNACEANLVLLSLRGENGFEPDTENWLNEWIARRDDEECALAVLIHSDLQGLHSIGQTLFWLQQITRPTLVRLFVGFMPSEEPPLPNPAPPENEPMPFLDRHIPDRLDLHSEGGLNE